MPPAAHRTLAGPAGSVYTLCLLLGMLLTVIGLATVAISRAGVKTTSDALDWGDAKALALSAVEH